MRITFAVMAIGMIWGCSSDDFTGQSGSQSRETKSSAQTEDGNRTPTDAVEEDEETSPINLPAEVSGSFLVNCEEMKLHDDGQVQYGCGAFKTDTGELIARATVFAVTVVMMNGDEHLPELSAAGNDPNWNVHFYISRDLGIVDHILVSASVDDEMVKNNIGGIQYAFVTTSTYYPGSTDDRGFIGVEGADAVCQKEADNASIDLGDRTWKAILHSTTYDPRSEIPIQGKVYSIRGTVIADTKDEFWLDGKRAMNSGIKYNSSGKSTRANVWTGIGISSGSWGQAKKETTCDDWTSNDNQKGGRYGESEDRHKDAYSDGSTSCNSDLALYCISL